MTQVKPSFFLRRSEGRQGETRSLKKRYITNQITEFASLIGSYMQKVRYFLFLIDFSTHIFPIEQKIQKTKEKNAKKRRR